MKIYKTTPDNITNIFTFQKNIKNEGFLATDKEFNIFFSNYTHIFENTLDEMDVFLSNIDKLITKFGELIDKVSSGVLASNSGGPIVSPTFVADLTTIKTDLTSIQQDIASNKSNLSTIKKEEL
ncbi:MAG: hypothetical protein LBH40_00765 [Alphaproteobacteria bacterium]|jgi:hypothetical protein|nr:hypothetical protein [Alphaproteobacteria bacterium]